MPMKVFLASPENRPLFSYIVQEFGYHFCSQPEGCDIIVAPDQGRARDEEYALNELLRKVRKYDRSRGVTNIQLLDKNGNPIKNVDPHAGGRDGAGRDGGRLSSGGNSKSGKRLQPALKLTKIPGMSDVCEKVRFHRLLQVVKPFFDREGLDLCVPDTYILPEQSNLLKKEFHGAAKPTIILKPEYGTQGSGIFLARGLPEVNAHIDRLVSSGTKKSVAQLYVENPLLLDGIKFDLRLYVVVTEVIPHLKGLLYREGLARFCTTRWKGSGHNDDRNKSESSHLTNYAINKKSLNFKEGSSKRLLSTTLQQLAKRYPDFSISEFWDQMQVISKNILLAISPCLLAEMLCTKNLINDPNFLQEVSYNHVLGLDILLDADFVPWLLELNATPSLSIEKIVLADRIPIGVPPQVSGGGVPGGMVPPSPGGPGAPLPGGGGAASGVLPTSPNHRQSNPVSPNQRRDSLMKLDSQEDNSTATPTSSVTTSNYQTSSLQSRSTLIQDIFRNRKQRRVFGGALCLCGDSVNPHFHIESEVDIRAKYGPIKTLLTDFSKTIHDPSSCFFMPNSAILANSVMQSLCLDHGGRRAGFRGGAAWDKHGIPRITVNRRGEVAIQETQTETLVATNCDPETNCEPTISECLPCEDDSAGKGTGTTATPAETPLESATSAATSGAGSETDSMAGNNIIAKIDIGNDSMGKPTNNIGKIDLVAGLTESSLKNINSTINPNAALIPIHDPNQNALVPHVNPKGVGIKVGHLPNFSEAHLIELQRILAQNEAFRSNRTTEPCQCPIILDVCNRNSEDSESITKIYKLFKKIADLYVETMINAREPKNGGNQNGANQSQSQNGGGNQSQNGGANQNQSGASSSNKLTLHDLQMKISSLVRSEPRLYQKHHQLPFDTILKSLERLQRDLLDANLLAPFPPPPAKRHHITLSAAKRGQGIKSALAAAGVAAGGSSNNNTGGSSTTGGTTTGGGSSTAGGSSPKRNMSTGPGATKLKRCPRMVEDTLGSGITQFLLGLTTLCQGGFYYYEDYDLGLGVQELILKIRNS